MNKMLPILLILPVFIGTAALAETSSSFEVSATIENGCEISDTNQNLDFGSHSAFSQDTVYAQISNTVQSWGIRCTVNLPVSIQLNSGQNVDSGVRRLKLQSQNEYISYRLYSDAARSTEYTGGQSYSLTPTTSAETLLQFSVYGAADLSGTQTSRPAGTYSDLVGITISW